MKVRPTRISIPRGMTLTSIRRCEREAPLPATYMSMYRKVKSRFTTLYQRRYETRLARGRADTGANVFPSRLEKCQERREEDEEPSGSPLQYTMLIELSQIIEKNWSLFEPLLSKNYHANKKLLTSNLTRLNWIRNAVVHPVKRRRWSESDFQFAAKLHADFK